MPDNQFDNFVNGKLNDHEAPVPNGLWDKLTDKQFDEGVGNKLKDVSAPVPEGLWDKITDTQFDNFLGDRLSNVTAPIPAGLWDKITDAQFDASLSDKISNYIAPVPNSLYDKVADGQFDSFVGNKLKDHSAPVPEGLWEKIHPEEEDRKVFFLFRVPVAASFILALLLGGAVAAYLVLAPLRNANKPSSNEISTKGSRGSGKSPVKVSAVTNEDKHTVTPGGASAEPTANDVAAQPAGAAGITPKTNAPDATSSALKESAVTNLTKGSGSTASVPGNLPPETSNNTVRNSRNNRLHANLVQAGNNKDGLITGSHAPGSITEAVVPPVTGAVDGGDSTTEEVVPYQQNLLTATTLPTPFNLQMGMNPSGMDLAESKHASQVKSNIICPTNRGNRNTDWLIEAYISPDVAFKSVSNISASQQYLQKKDSSESMQLGYTAGFRIVKPITDNILIKAGLQYSQINQKYVYRTENEIKTTTVVTVRTIIRAPGDTVIVADTSMLQQIGFKNNIVKNRFRSIDVPVTIGYQFGDEDLKFGINAGVVFNLSSWYEGVILDTSLAIVPLTKSNDMVYKSKLGMGLYAGFSVTKRLSDDMHIFFEPYFRYNLSGITSPQASYNQKFSLGGISIGLRFNLNRQ